MTDAKLYSHTKTKSNHITVYICFHVQWSKLYHKKPRQFCTAKRNIEKLKDPLTKALPQKTVRKTISSRGKSINNIA